MKASKDSPIIYESKPPRWLSKTHPSADLGYPDFYPPRPGQEEDLLSEVNITKGFCSDKVIPAETFSAQDSINTRLFQNDALIELEDLMNLVFKRRADLAPSVPTSSFRMPSRVTLNDAKRQAWFADLANPEVPLQKLGKSVPHGAKGHDLLDLLQINNVAIPRAVWFLRVFGANEIAGLKNKPSYNPTQYSVEWANIVTNYLKKQLADIALPSAPRPGLNIKQTFKGVLADSENRERWISRFTYCLKLLRTFYSEGLVDHRTFLSWLVLQMVTCNLAQAAFVARLADEYLAGMLSSRALVQPFADACLSKLSELRSSSARDHLFSLDTLLRSLLQRICCALPDAFVCPRMWTNHAELLNEVMTNALSSPASYQRGLDEVHQMILDSFSDIKRRNEAMLFHNMPRCTTASLSSAMSDIQLLNSVTSTSDLEAINYFDTQMTNLSILVDKMATLLTWAVTPLQYGDHRPFAAVTLLGIWRTKNEIFKYEHSSNEDFIHDQIFDWLDSSEVAQDPANLAVTASFVGQLIQHNLFSYEMYIQRLIARGESGLSFKEALGSRHRSLLRCIPIYNLTKSLSNQRKMMLHGPRARETEEDSIEREIRKEIRVLLPELFGNTEVPMLTKAEFFVSCPIFISASRYEQVRTFRMWLLPLLLKNISSGMLASSQLLHSYCTSVELMAYVKCFDCVLELSLCMLENTLTIDLLTAVIETIQRYLTVWACMQSSGVVLKALFAAHQTWRTQGVQSRALLSLLEELDNGHILDVTSRAQLSTDVSTFTHALLPVTDHAEIIPPVLPEILLLAEDSTPDGPSLLANGLWYKYRTSYKWAWTVWDNTVASLRQIPLLTSDPANCEAFALRYGAFLLQVDHHLPSGLDDQVLDWFLGTGRNEVAALSGDAWNVLTTVLVFLVIHGAIKTTTILRGLVYPSWQLGMTAPSGQLGNSLEVFIFAANHLTKQLLLRGEEIAADIPALKLFDEQRLRTRLQDVYREPHFSLLASNIPSLVLVENNLEISDALRASCRSLRRALCRNVGFHEGLNRNMNAVRDAFEQSLQLEDSNPHYSDYIVDALHWIWSDSETSSVSNMDLGDWIDMSSLLSSWKLSATAIQFQFILWQLERSLAVDATRETSNARFNALTTAIFQYNMSSEEAHLLAEMLQGIGTLVTEKFLNNGFESLSGILEEVETDPDALSRCVQRSGDILRFLAHLTEPLRHELGSLPPLASAIQDKFIHALQTKFTVTESLLASPSGEGPRSKKQQATQCAILLARLLQFDLGFPGIWTPDTKICALKLSSSLFQLALVHSVGDTLDLLAYPIMIDTLYYLLDEIPSEKNASFDPFRNYSTMSHSELPLELSHEYRMQLRALLPYVASHATVTNLMSAHRDAEGKLVYDSPVLNRPWEWIEHLGDNPILDAKDEEKERQEKARLGMKYLIKNSASLSLETFEARITGDGILHNIVTGDDPRVEGNIRLFEDGLSAESVLERDWRQTRLELVAESSTSSGRTRGDDGDESDAIPALTQITKSPSTPRKPSPTSSAGSRIITASILHSPGLGSIKELVASPEGDAMGTEGVMSNHQKSAKRKAESDDEPKAIGASGHVPKESNVKSPGKGRSKKRRDNCRYFLGLLTKGKQRNKF